MSELFVWKGEIDWIIAESAEEAREISKKFYGQDCEEDEKFIQCPMDEVLEVHYEDGQVGEGDYEIVKKTMREWIKSQGKGWFCSSEW